MRARFPCPTALLSIVVSIAKWAASPNREQWHTHGDFPTDPADKAKFRKWRDGADPSYLSSTAKWLSVQLRTHPFNVSLASCSFPAASKAKTLASSKR